MISFGGTVQAHRLGYRPTYEEICGLHPDFGQMIQNLDKRFVSEGKKLAEVKTRYKSVMDLNATCKPDTHMKSTVRYLCRCTKSAEENLEFVEASLGCLQRIVDCLSNDFNRVDHGMVVSTQVEHLEYIDDLNAKCDLLDQRVMEHRDRVNLMTCTDETRLYHVLCDDIANTDNAITNLNNLNVGSS